MRLGYIIVRLLRADALVAGRACICKLGVLLCSEWIGGQ